MIQDLSGQRFGKLTAIRQSGFNNRKEPLWFCECDCGGHTIVKSYLLRIGKTQSCGCKQRGVHRKSLVGERFGRLRVQSEHSKNKWRDYHYYCLCDCGNITIVTGASLRQGKTKSCGCWQSEHGWEGYGEISGSYWNSIKHHAKRRGIKLMLTIDEAWAIFLKQNRKCALTGEELFFSRQYKDRKQTASIDRIDSNKNYTVDNVQWVHKEINKMKLDHSQSKFIELCRKVVKYVERIDC